ncbi:hypothetical protein V5799_008166 [Amblyomma americanum]|uniref:GH18 domain-containing protein n=1 Tax=Amblyomma americanum TaxID=6943 RepID=A0AAQ4FFQ3_AMBAM
MPLFLLLLPYLASHTKASAWKEAFATPKNAEVPVEARKGSATLPLSAGDDPLLGLPPACRGKSADPLADDLTGINDDYPDNSALRLPVTPTTPVLCLYNNSLFRRQGGHDFLPRHLPLNLCSGLIYWSMGLAAGRLRSRAPEFDRRYGIEQLHRIRAAQRSSVPIYVALGGYPEDAAEFYLLAASPPARAPFVADVLMNLRRYRLDGIVVHWVAHGNEGCRARMKDVVTGLADLLDDLRAVLALNFPDSAGLVGLMAPADVSLANSMLSHLGDRADLVLLSTYTTLEAVQVPAGEAPAACYRSMKSVLERLRSYADLRLKMCVSLSLALHARGGGGSQYPLPATNISRMAGYRAVFELCGSSGSGFRAVEGADETKSIVRARTEDGTWYSLDSHESLRRKMSYGKGGPGDRDMCILVHDLDLDAYATPCRGKERYILLRHVLNASTEGNIFDVRPYLP